MNQGTQKPSYNEIKEYIRNLLQMIKNGNKTGPLESFNSLTREVFIKAFNQNLDEVRRVYEIPNPQEKPTAFRDIWVEVFLGCLDYYKKKLQKKGIIITETETGITINGVPYALNDTLTYINILEQLSIKMDKLKEKDVNAPMVNTKSVIIGSREKLTPSAEINQKTNNEMLESKIYRDSITNDSTDLNKLAQAKLSATFPQGNYPISSIKTETNSQSEYNMNISKPKEEMTSKELNTYNKAKIRKKVNYPKFKELQETRFVSPRITEDDILTDNDIKNLLQIPLMFVSGATSNKIETTFFDNLEIIKNKRIKTPIAAFISGQITTTDKVTKEAMKIIKMCSKGINSGIICYELNNENLRLIEDDKQILEAVRSAEQICDILQNEGYSPLICVDLDVRTQINNTLLKLDPNHILHYPVLSRISSKELDDIASNEDLLIMDPGFDNDQIILTQPTKNYVVNAVNKNINKYKTPSKVA